MDEQVNGNNPAVAPSALSAGLCVSSLATPVPNILEIHNREAQEVLRISPDGRIFWKQREIETDDEFRMAMLELKDALVKNMSPSRDGAA